MEGVVGSGSVKVRDGSEMYAEVGSKEQLELEMALEAGSESTGGRRKWKKGEKKSRRNKKWKQEIEAGSERRKREVEVGSVSALA
jgi:hypothetical protein